MQEGIIGKISGILGAGLPRSSDYQPKAWVSDQNGVHVWCVQ